ncbi:galactose/methyl galactoside ABC transporter permease MglC [Streptobacillus ratti]|uniref:galactose/methyl galactoside ABC transporter permease MglC n=1 Tax=Streptobacillus ratti TaxID=1720557 RepID=UPI0009335758|nr:beta-methylgalactoside transporter permease [Streptobacillus ratti]
MNNEEIKKLKSLFINGGIYLVLLLLFVVIVIKEPSFLKFRNVINILTQSSVKMIIALGVAGIIVTQGTDLSAGRQIGIAGLVTASLLQSIANPNKVYKFIEEYHGIKGLFSSLAKALGFADEPAFVTIFITLILVILIGATIGLINGILVSKFNIVPFVATMGMMIIAYGANSLYFDYTGSTPIAGFSSSYSSIVGNIEIGELYIPKLIIYALIAIFVMWIVWNKTVFGKNLFAVGGNPEAAKVSGVNVTKTLILVYIISGIMYAIGGFLEAARIGSASNNLGNLYELDAIAACVVGGVSFSGGVGKISGVVAGVIIFTMINYGLTYIGVNPYWQYIIKGLIIIVAVGIDMLKYKKKN